MPTYNFAVVVDDWDMRITHVFRGDEHVNNTPWQINIFRALGAPLPRVRPLPIILGDDGQKLSKRRGAVSVTAYEDEGYLPEAMLNYLARLGWSHGDDELFSREQMVAVVRRQPPGRRARRSGTRPSSPGSTRTTSSAPTTPRLRALVHGAARAARHRRPTTDERLAARVRAVQGPLQHRRVELADWLRDVLRATSTPSADDLAAHVTDAVRPALATLARQARRVAWDKAAIAAAIKETLAGARPEDAAARAGRARAGLRPGADAVARRRARAVRARRSVLARACGAGVRKPWL